MTELLEKQTEAPISTGEDDVRQFLREIREFPRLTLEEERDLARRCAEIIRDAALRQSLSQNAVARAEVLLDAESYKQALREAYGTGGTQ